MQQQVSIWKSGADAGICPAQPGAYCIAWRTTRRPEYLLRHVLCAQLHCRDWVFTSTCRIHAQLLRPPKRTAALHDLSRKQRCHADALLLPTVKALRRQSFLPGAEPGAGNVVRHCTSRQAPSVNLKDLWDTLWSAARTAHARTESGWPGEILLQGC